MSDVGCRVEWRAKLRVCCYAIEYNYADMGEELGIVGAGLRNGGKCGVGGRGGA